MTEKQEYAALDGQLVFGIPIIDTQHANLIRIANNLRLACLVAGTETANPRFLRAVREAVDYIRNHFNTEEKLMVLLDFPDYHTHKKEHDDFIWEILSHAKQFQEEQGLVPEKFAYSLSDWINSHIGSSDKTFADFFLAMKHHGKLRLILSGIPKLSATSAGMA